MRPFGFATATEILFGRGIAPAELAKVGQLGRRALLVTGGKPDRLAAVVAPLREQQRIGAEIQITGEPTVDDARSGVAAAREADCDLVISIGGGSVIDTGKAIAALLSNGGDPLDYLEVIGAGRQITRPSAVFVAVPTTSGTGAEVTRNAVL